MRANPACLGADALVGMAWLDRIHCKRKKAGFQLQDGVCIGQFLLATSARAVDRSLAAICGVLPGGCTTGGVALRGRPREEISMKKPTILLQALAFALASM